MKIALRHRTVTVTAFCSIIAIPAMGHTQIALSPANNIQQAVDANPLIPHSYYRLAFTAFNKYNRKRATNSLAGPGLSLVGPRY